MTRKSEACYRSLFTYIRDHIFSMEGATIISDYEKGMRNALKNIFPMLLLFSCWFHFTQAVVKKGKSISKFFSTIMHDPALKQLFHKFLALPLLPDENIKDAFQLLQLEANASNPVLFKPFLKYFHSQWMIRVHYKHIFIHELFPMTSI